MASRRADWDTAREGIGPTTPVGRFQRLLDAAESDQEIAALLEVGAGTVRRGRGRGGWRRLTRDGGTLTGGRDGTVQGWVLRQ